MTGLFKVCDKCDFEWHCKDGNDCPICKKNIISEFNNLIFSNQIERTSSNIKFTERILDKYYEKFFSNHSNNNESFRSKGY